MNVIALLGIIFTFLFILNFLFTINSIITKQEKKNLSNLLF